MYIAANSTVKLNSGSITGNINSSSVAGNTGGGVYVQWNSTNPNFTKTGGTIYGDMDNTHTAGRTENTATATTNPGTNGHAVLLDKSSVYYYRNETLTGADNISATDMLPANSGETLVYWTKR